MQWLSAPCGRPGRPAHFSDSAIELCLTLKALFNLPLRQATGLVASLLKLADLDWSVPDYTTLCRRQKTLPVTLGGRSSSGGLHLLVDSTGIIMMGEAHSAIVCVSGDNMDRGAVRRCRRTTGLGRCGCRKAMNKSCLSG